ncbi:hypothetical protein [Gordonia hongkongensis]|uniref:hypothetical protein n=1 Tax=Gordonia hongkongensis TaxID=1701090 RepID=UPI003EB6A2E1
MLAGIELKDGGVQSPEIRWLITFRLFGCEEATHSMVDGGRGSGGNRTGIGGLPAENRQLA